MKYKETGIINEYIVQSEDVKNIQEMWDFQQQVRESVDNYPKAKLLLEQVLGYVKEAVNGTIGDVDAINYIADLNIDEFLKT